MSEKPERSPQGEFLPKGRLEAFADGVLAIVITILVLELKVPELEAGESLASGLLAERRLFVGYLISFVFVGGIWIAHTNATRLFAHADSMLYRLNILVLFWVSLLPFTTSVMTEFLGGDAGGEAVALYGLNLFVASLTLNVFVNYVAVRPDLVNDQIDDEELVAIVRHRRNLLPVLFVATLVAFVLPDLAVALYLLITIAFIAVPMLIARTQTASRTR